MIKGLGEPQAGAFGSRYHIPQRLAKLATRVRFTVLALAAISLVALAVHSWGTKLLDEAFRHLNDMDETVEARAYAMRRELAGVSIATMRHVAAGTTGQASRIDRHHADFQKAFADFSAVALRDAGIATLVQQIGLAYSDYRNLSGTIMSGAGSGGAALDGLSAATARLYNELAESGTSKSREARARQMVLMDLLSDLTYVQMLLASRARDGHSRVTLTDGIARVQADLAVVSHYEVPLSERRLVERIAGELRTLPGPGTNQVAAALNGGQDLFRMASMHQMLDTMILRAWDSTVRAGRIADEAAGKRAFDVLYGSLALLALPLLGIAGLTLQGQRLSNESLTQAAEQLRLAAGASGVSIWDANLKTGEIYLSEQWSRLLTGTAADTWTTQESLRIVVHPADIDRVVGAAKAVCAGRIDRCREELRVQTQSGAWRWILVTGSVVERDEASSRPLRMIGTNVDITEIKRAQEAIAEQERETKQLLDALPVAIAFADNNEVIQYHNLAYALLFGVSEQALVGRTEREVHGDAIYRDLGPHIRGALEGQSTRLELPTQSGFGELVHLAISFVPNIEIDGRVAGYYQLLADVTELKHLDRMKDEFVSTVSHELRTPLTAIRGALSLLTGPIGNDLSPQVRRVATVALASSERLGRLVNDILDFEKIASGKIRLMPEQIDLAKSAAYAAEQNEEYAKAHKVDIRVNAPGEVTISGDRDRLQQVFTNLISNAVKHSPQGGIVEIHVDVNANRARVAVRDHGPGVPDDFRAKLFERFAQAEGVLARTKDGTGLGLAITKAIVELHGGAIGYEDAAGGGALFWFELPLRGKPALHRSSNGSLVMSD
jgi:PAS domain S-box-containing protein